MNIKGRSPCKRQEHIRAVYKSGQRKGSSYCKTCVYERTKIFAQSPQYKTKRAIYRQRYRYGVNELPSGPCQICSTRLATTQDHDHSSGKPRGFLCNKCNVLLAGVEDTQWTKNAQDYLGRWL